MADKILVIISAGDIEKALTGMMYAINAVTYHWMNEVKLFFFGPAEELLAQSSKLQQSLKEYHEVNEPALACKFIADRDGYAEPTARLGVKVEYVGKMISDLVKTGYIPMVW
jgi:hypothetical protein